MIELLGKTPGFYTSLPESKISFDRITNVLHFHSFRIKLLFKCNLWKGLILTRSLHLNDRLKRILSVTSSPWQMEEVVVRVQMPDFFDCIYWFSILLTIYPAVRRPLLKHEGILHTSKVFLYRCIEICLLVRLWCCENWYTNVALVIAIRRSFESHQMSSIVQQWPKPTMF
jgi:hypothetical protein